MSRRLSGRSVRPGLGPYLVGVGRLVVAANTTATMHLPQEAKSSDLLVGVLNIQGTQTITTLSGWTLIGDTLYNASANHFSTFYRFCGDSARIISWTLSGSVTYSAYCLAFRGIDLSAPLDTFAELEDQASTASPQTPGITTSFNDLLLGVIATAGTRHATKIDIPYLQLPTAIRAADRTIILATKNPSQPFAFPAATHTISSSAAYGSQVVGLRVGYGQ